MKLVGVNIDGLHNTSMNKYCFRPDVNFLTGKNGSGKSTILQAIQLALLGYISGTAKTKSSILSHSFHNSITVELRLSDYQTNQDITVRRSFIKTGKNISENLEIYPDNYTIEDIVRNSDISILNFDEFLALSSNKQKEMLISMLPSCTDSFDASSCFINLDSYTSNCKELLDEIIERFPRFTTVADIASCNSYLKEVQSRLNAEDKRLTSTVQSLMFYDEYSGTYDTESIRQTLNQLMHKRDEISEIEHQLEAKQRIQTKLDSHELTSLDQIDTFIQDRTEILSTLKADITCIESSIDDKTKEKNKLLLEKAMYQNVINSENTCPLMNTTCESLEAYVSEVTTLYNDVTSRIDMLDADLRALKETLSKKLSIYNENDEALKDLEYEKKTLTILYTELQQYTDIKYPEVSSAEIKKEIETLHQDLIKASANKQYNEMMKKLQEQRYTLTETIKFVKAAIKLTSENGLQSELSLKAFKDFSTNFNKYLDDLELSSFGSVHFVISEKLNSFDFGITRNDKFISFNQLSSGEKCIFTLIFQVVLNRLAGYTLNFILIDDLFDHLDAKNLKTVIKNIHKLSQYTQIFIAGIFDLETVDSCYITNLDDGVYDY